MRSTPKFRPHDKRGVKGSRVQMHDLVTGNSRHFPEKWLETQIVTPLRFAEIAL